MPTINDPLTLPCGQTFHNRLVKAAMTEGLANGHGTPTDELIRLYSRWADADLGMMLTGNVQVDRHHLERAGNPIVADKLSVLAAEKFADWSGAASMHGTKMWAQLSHAGRQTPFNINRQPKAPSAVQLDVSKVMKFGQPVAMTADDIEHVVEAFAAAACELQKFGFHGVQVHAAHGYLLSQFLSPLANTRTDEYGGSLGNRARLLLRIVKKIRHDCGPDFGLGVKLNSADFQRGGFALSDSQQVARWLDDAEIDLLEISGGNYENPLMVGGEGEQSEAQLATSSREAYFLDFAPRIAEQLQRAKLMVTGGFRSAAAMNEALANDSVDLIGIGRPLCGDPVCTARLLDGNIDELPRFENACKSGREFSLATAGSNSSRTSIPAPRRHGITSSSSASGRASRSNDSYRILSAAMAHRKRDEAMAKRMKELGETAT